MGFNMVLLFMPKTHYENKKIVFYALAVFPDSVSNSSGIMIYNFVSEKKVLLKNVETCLNKHHRIQKENQNENYGQQKKEIY